MGHCYKIPAYAGMTAFLRGDDGFLSGEALLFDPACDGIGFTLLDFFVMAEDFAESAFEKLTQTSNCDDVKRAPRLQVFKRIE